MSNNSAQRNRFITAEFSKYFSVHLRSDDVDMIALSVQIL